MDNPSNYWTGKNIDYKKLRDDFNENENQYIEKFELIDGCFLEIAFHKPSTEFPLFNAEAIFKTLKGLYHDFKKNCLSGAEYDKAAPLFLYSIERGSAVWSFMMDYAYSVPFLYVLARGLLKNYESILNVQKTKLEIDLLKKKLYELNEVRDTEEWPEISISSLDDFIKKYELPFENIEKQHLKKITIYREESTKFEIEKKKVELIAIHFDEKIESSEVGHFPEK